MLRLNHPDLQSTTSKPRTSQQLLHGDLSAAHLMEESGLRGKADCFMPFQQPFTSALRQTLWWMLCLVAAIHATPARRCLCKHTTPNSYKEEYAEFWQNTDSA